MIKKTNIKVKIKMDKKTDVEIVKPFLKWVGGKTQILTEVLNLFPKEINNYYEPFLGGGSVLLGFLSYVKSGIIKLNGKVIVSDLNRNLIGLYKNIQQKPNEFLKEIDKLVKEYNGINGKEVNRKPKSLEEAKTSQESYYYWIRNCYNKLTNDEKVSLVGSSMFLFMNKTCFRGVYREGPNGFNVPFGNYKNPGIVDEKEIIEISELIKDVDFRKGSFEEILGGIELEHPTDASVPKELEENDFIYLDPPYAPENDSSFVGYNKDGFSIENHNYLFELCNELVDKNIKILMSNSDVDLVNNSFSIPKFKIKKIECRRAINSKKPDAKTNEVLIYNYR